ncbi:MAG: geranylgeranylglyceryl/heptaprenylglyceryl phosphate synthase [Candidatus Methanomethylophilaceae archaeon]|nr:geranylgeranylglyceryl/heptaprenylglyceryl phosphate synthase [Candidatus Methanomethylophilaceae archaeon]MBO5669083.1 geranylgeranylglyceryl/heptaprenylglyceryl phosphate synthase [Candidatus Methanomethylophilaceae archaeon]MBO7205382.1 geranylgeranylglyceryl/heptaprenylglyceryl phosphate synthase [Candidatus Methanomethylophilaceae archaeon]
MTVKEYIMERIENGSMHMTLLDPDKQSAEDAAKIAVKCKDAGTDAFMIGGSTGITSENLDATAVAIREATGLPIIYFPAGPHAIPTKADAMFYMSLVNSRNLDMVIRSQAKASRYVKKIGVETMSMAYIVCEPGMKVGEVGQADLIEKDDIDTAVGYALGCEMMGMEFVYLEAGSGADEPISPEMIRAVKDAISVPLIIGGGISTPEAAVTAKLAGADIIVTGTFVERCIDESMLKNVIAASKN